MLKEKIIERAAKKVVIVCDESKLVKKLGQQFPLPVEVTKFSYEFTRRQLEGLPSLRGCRGVVRRGSITNNKADGTEIATTSNGNYIIDLFFDLPIKDVGEAAYELDSVSGVVDHGLCLGLVTTVLVATSNDGVRIVGFDGESPYWNGKNVCFPNTLQAIKMIHTISSTILNYPQLSSHYIHINTYTYIFTHVYTLTCI